MENNATEIQPTQAQEPTAPTAPDIKPLGDYGVMLEVHVSLPPFKRHDKRAGKQVAFDNNANIKQVSVSKKLLDMPELDALVRLKTEIYAVRGDFGTPMGVNQYFIPNDRIIDCKNVLEELLSGFNGTAKQPFIDAYPAGVIRAQLNAEGLGEMFDPSQYPSVDSLYSKISASASWDRLPSTGVMSEIHKQAQETLRDEFAHNANKAQETLMNGVWDRLRTPLLNMSKRLDYGDDGKPKDGGFKGSLVSNVLEIVDLMKCCNVGNDPRMEQVRIDLRNALTGVTYDSLKNSDGMRRKTKTEVDKIIENLPSLGW
jgi:hypothetical protein